ncbi:hypothetical protein ACXR2T_09835 [Leucobacter sp. HY1910]
MKKQIIALAAAALVALPLAACSTTLPADADIVPGNDGGTKEPTTSEVVFDTTHGVTAEYGTPVTVKLPDELVELVDDYQNIPFESITVQTIMLDSMENCAVQFVHTPKQGADLAWLTDAPVDNEFWGSPNPSAWAVNQLTGNASDLKVEPFALSEFSEEDPEKGVYFDLDELTVIKVDRCADATSALQYTASFPTPSVLNELGQTRTPGSEMFDFGTDSAGNIAFPLPRDDGQSGTTSYYLNSAGKWMKG